MPGLRASLLKVAWAQPTKRSAKAALPASVAKKSHWAIKSARAAGETSTSGMTTAALGAAGFEFGEDLIGGNPLAAVQLFDAFEQFLLQFLLG